MNLNDFKCFLNDFLPINNFLICINPAKKDDNFILPDESGLVKATKDFKSIEKGDHQLFEPAENGEDNDQCGGADHHSGDGDRRDDVDDVVGFLRNQASPCYVKGEIQAVFLRIYD